MHRRQQKLNKQNGITYRSAVHEDLVFIYSTHSELIVFSNAKLPVQLLLAVCAAFLCCGLGLYLFGERVAHPSLQARL